MLSAEFILQKNYFDKRKNLGNFSLVQLGRMVCHGAHVIATHTHLDWFELTSVLSGEGEILANGEKVYISKGDIYLSFPCETHAIYSSEKHPLKFDFMSFVPIKDKVIKTFDALTSEIWQSSRRLIRDSRIPGLVDGCVEIFLDGEKNKTEFASLSLELITMELAGFFKKKQTDADNVGNSRESGLCNDVNNYIDTHIFSIRNLSELSDITSYNYSYLSNVYKNTTGETISDYYNNKRFEKAKMLLEEGGRSITEISALLGYSSVYAFSKAFKDRMGIPPTRYNADGENKYEILRY